MTRGSDTEPEAVGDAERPCAVGVFAQVTGGAEAVWVPQGYVVVVRIVVIYERVERRDQLRDRA